MNAEIIVIGDELLIGQVTDTNSGWIAREMNRVGWEITEITTVRDRRAEITSALDQAFARVDAVLMTGGLGPTKDDITKQTLCDYFGGTMIFDDSVLRHNEELFRERGFQMNDSTHSQAYVPDVCDVLPNRVGTAPIMWFDRNGKVLVSMPGVPSEMETAMSETVIPRLRNRFPLDFAILHHTSLVRGFTESRLSETLTDFEAELPASVKLAYLPKPGVIRLRLTARGTDEETLRPVLEQQAARLRAILGDHLFCDEDTTLAGALGKMLQRRGLTLATAESCTGGNIAHQITEIPGSSAYYKGSVVSYANEVKEKVLGVNRDTLLRCGAVSREVVEQMVEGVQRLLQTDCAVATSGIAGPDGGTAEKPVGTVWIACRKGMRTESRLCRFSGTRDGVIQRASRQALLMLIELLDAEK